MVLTRPCRLGPPGGPVIPLPGIIPEPWKEEREKAEKHSPTHSKGE